MTKRPLSRLECVNLREYWQTENTKFTPWMSEAANIQLLADTLGVLLEVEETEASVGPFRAGL